MTHDEMYSMDELVAYAAAAGFRVKPRQITDWVARGLLAKPVLRGRGHQKGVARLWPQNQADLLVTLHTLRPQVRSWLHHLCNIPVYLWVYWGDDYVDLDQARRAMGSWVGTYGRSSWRAGERTARRLAEQLAPGNVDPKIQRDFIDYITDLAHDPDGIDQPSEIQRQLEAILNGRRELLGHNIHVPTLAKMMAGRIRAAEAIERFTDEQYLASRQELLLMRASHNRSNRHPDEGDLTSEMVNRACLELLTHLSRHLD